MFNIIATAITSILQTVHNFVGDWGITIAVTAILLRLILLPLTITQIKSMAIMQKVGKAQKKLQEWFGSDKEGFNKAIMEMYNKFKFNPMAGCLPLIAFMLIMFGVYRSLVDPNNFYGENVWGVQIMNPVFVNFAYPTVKPYINFDDASILTIAPSFINFKIMVYYLALPFMILYMATAFIMQQVMSLMSGANDPSMQQNPSSMKFQKIMMGAMLVLFGFIIPTGALIYFTVQSLWMGLEYSILPKLKIVKPSFTDADIEALLAKLDPRPDKERRMEAREQVITQEGDIVNQSRRRRRPKRLASADQLTDTQSNNGSVFESKKNNTDVF